MTYSQKYTLVHFTSPIEDGEQFPMSKWPLHTTLADVFAVNRHKTTIDTKLVALLAQIQPVNTSALNDDILGTTPVVLLDKTPPLLKLHTDIVSLLEENDAIFNNPEFTRNGFLPHSTIQKSGRLHASDRITIDSISLVDMFPDDDQMQRKVLTTFKLRVQ